MVRPAQPGCSLPTALIRVVAVVMVATIGVAVAGDESETDMIATSPGTSYSRAASSGWNAATRTDDSSEKMPRPESSLTLRAYDGFDRLRPYYGDDLAYGVDVTTDIEECPNGTKRIRALNIGGWLFEVDGDCSDYRRGSRVSVSQGRQDIGASEDTIGAAVMRCDPATWRCHMIDR